MILGFYIAPICGLFLGMFKQICAPTPNMKQFLPHMYVELPVLRLQIVNETLSLGI